MSIAQLRARDATGEVIAVVLPDGTPEQPEALQDFVATGTMLLVRQDDGSMTLETVRFSTPGPRPATSHGSRRRPILDPVTREIVGYELEARTHSGLANVGLL